MAAKSTQEKKSVVAHLSRPKKPAYGNLPRESNFAPMATNLAKYSRVKTATLNDSTTSNTQFGSRS
eukprot:1190265-Prorocentrum_minimum.AAC.3